ncbi:MAG: YbjN domain-containing protein [Oscillospiraceae bacterium]|nr:YbjN domain-containing protein [Oscillospiraceae bacterium]
MQELMMQKMREYFQEQQWNFDERQNVFISGFTLDGYEAGAMFQIAVHEKSFLVLTAPDMEIPEEKFSDILIYAAELNRLLGIGCAYLDQEEKMLTFRTSLICADNPPTIEQVGAITGYTMTMMQDIVTQLLPLLNGEISPEEAAAKTVKPE